MKITLTNKEEQKYNELKALGFDEDIIIMCLMKKFKITFPIKSTKKITTPKINNVLTENKNIFKNRINKIINQIENNSNQGKVINCLIINNGTFLSLNEISALTNLTTRQINSVFEKLNVRHKEIMQNIKISKEIRNGKTIRVFYWVDKFTL